MKLYKNRIALLAVGTTAFLAACGGESNSNPGAVARVAMGGTSALATQASSWSSVKWGGGGMVTGLIFHPKTQDLLYARTDVGGAYRWNQGASQWAPITDGFTAAEFAYHNVESIGLDPKNNQRVYLVAGNGGNGRLYTSNNQGASWTWVALPFVVSGNAVGRGIGERLRLDPTNPSTMFYGSRMAGLWKSSDSGQTWAQVTGLSSYTTSTVSVGVEQIIFDNENGDPNQPNQTTWNIWAAVAPDYANAAGLSSTFFRSSNGGYSWTPVAVPAAVAGYYIPHFARAADGMYYVVFNANPGPNGGGPGYLYKYSGLGGVWTLLSSSTAGGYGGVSVSGTGATTRIALGVTNTWGDFAGQQIVKLSDNAGGTWREIESQMPHTPADSSYWGANDDIEIDPFNNNHILHVNDVGIYETLTASSATPSWTKKVANFEETATLALATPPAGATYKLINSAGDIGTWVQTDLATKPTKGPSKEWTLGRAADMSWSNSQYIAGTGLLNQQGGAGTGFWSGDGGNTWATFATLPAGGAAAYKEVSSIAVTAPSNVIWAPTDTVPSYTTNNGANWTATNLPALSPQSWERAYRVAADRQNQNKVYAYDSGGVPWSGTPGRVYVSTNGGHTFTLSQGSVAANLRANAYKTTSMAVNPNVEGDVWLADGNTVYHSVDSGATWTKLNNFASVWGNNDPNYGTPDLQGASYVTLGKAAAGAPYSATVYVMGTINGQTGVWASSDAGSTWARFNDDGHQFGGISIMAGDWNTYGRIYVNGAGRGILYSN